MINEYVDLNTLGPSKLHKALIILSIPVTIICLYLVFIWSPVERIMGPVQKIFYFHVAAAMICYLAFFIVFLFSALYLFTKKRKYDLLAGVSGELGVLFTVIVLITGPIWARSAWNTWWTWEPRLTTTLILFFMYVAYLVIRNLEMEWQKKARLSGVFGIIGLINIPIVHFSVQWWGSTLHPQVIAEQDTGSSGLEPSMYFTLMFSLFTLSLIYFILLQKGYNAEKLKLYAQKMKNRKYEKMMD